MGGGGLGWAGLGWDGLGWGGRDSWGGVTPWGESFGGVSFPVCPSSKALPWLPPVVVGHDSLDPPRSHLLRYRRRWRLLRSPEDLFLLFHVISWGMPVIFCILVLAFDHAGKSKVHVQEGAGGGVEGVP